MNIWMRRCLILALLQLLIACAAMDPNHILTRRIGNEALPAGVALDTDTRQRAYDFVWNRVNEAYVDPNLNGVDWKKIGEEHQSTILSAPTDEAFWKSLDKMVGELGDAHTRVLSAKQYAYDKEKRAYTIGLGVADLQGELIVTGIAKDSPAEKAGIAKGNKLLKIEGMEANDWWRLQLSKARKNSSERAQAKSVKRVLNSGDLDAPSDSIALQVERNDGTAVDLTLQRAELPRKDSLNSKMLDEQIGYLRLSSFDASLGKEIQSNYDKVRAAKGLIIDLRGNGGGSLGVSLVMMNHLVQGTVPIGKRITRSGKPPALFFGLISTGKLELELRGVKNPYLAPVVVLVDGDSASASEFLASSLQGIGRAIVLGETSCGCLLGYMGYANVPGGGALAYSEIDFAPVNGKRIERVGVIPDQQVSLRKADLRANKDAGIEAAVQTLKNMQQESVVKLASAVR
ncbi:MAG: S41 family peptidase [Candidatus Aquirickettsiella gammari]